MSVMRAMMVIALCAEAVGCGGGDDTKDPNLTTDCNGPPCGLTGGWCVGGQCEGPCSSPGECITWEGGAGTCLELRDTGITRGGVCLSSSACQNWAACRLIPPALWECKCLDDGGV
jgi:hypothetical protein